MKPKYRVNGHIKATEVLLISSTGELLGTVPLDKALAMASEQGFDLVEITSKDPPVCKMMHYDKHCYNESRKIKHKSASTKEYKFRPTTGSHDYGVKLRAIREQLSKGGRVKVVLRFLGREVMHTDVGMSIVNNLVTDTADIAKVELAPKKEGNCIRALLIPKA